MELENIVQQFGFEVRSVFNANRADILKTITSFVRVTKQQHTVNMCIFFYTGYAVNFKEDNLFASYC